MLQSTPVLIGFQGVFRTLGIGPPILGLLLSPLASASRLWFHHELGKRDETSLLTHAVKLSASTILKWGAGVCGLADEYRAAARWIDITSCGILLSEAMEALAAQVSHIFALAIYGSSLETPLQKESSYDFGRLSQLAKRFFLALAHFQLSLTGEGSEYLLVHNVDFLSRQFRLKGKCKELLEYLLPGKGEAAEQLIGRAYEKVHVTQMDRVASGVTSMKESVLQSIGLQQPALAPPTEEKPLDLAICWRA